VAGENVFIYLHCASEGKKLDIINQNGNVCFEADCSYKLLKSENAHNWSAEYESVIGEGKISIVKEENQKIRALDILMKRHGFEGKPHYPEASLKAVTVLRICTESITGKRHIK